MILRKLHQALFILETAIEKFGLSKIGLAFNGGKDASVVLALLRMVLKKKKLSIGMVPLFFHNSGKEFPEVLTFVYSHSDLPVYELKGEMKDSLRYFIDTLKIEAIIMGTRRNDSIRNSNLTPFSESEDPWPRLTRVLPILDWDYPEVWNFIDRYDVPYCCLYEYGYTSLGTIEDTYPNHALYRAEFGFLHARELSDPSFERASRYKLSS